MVLAITMDITLPSWLDADHMKTILVGLMGLFIGFAMISAWVTKKIFTRVLYVGIFVGLSIFTYSQRNNLIDCVDKIATSKSQATTCRVAGFDVRVPTDKIPGGGGVTPATPTVTTATG